MTGGKCAASWLSCTTCEHAVVPLQPPSQRTCTWLQKLLALTQNFLHLYWILLKMTEKYWCVSFKSAATGLNQRGRREVDKE